MTEAELGMTPDSEDVGIWEAYLDDFRTFYFPLFEKRGFTFADAFQVWMLTRVIAELRDLAGIIRGDT